MNTIAGDVLVPAFFVSGTLAMFYLAWRFMAQKAPVYRSFGKGLLLYGLAFAVWSALVISKPASLEPYTTIGAVPFVLAHLFYLQAAADKLSVSKKSTVYLLAAAYVAVLFVLRTVVYRSEPSFSANGLFYFNAKPVVIAMYIGAFSASLLPAVSVMATRIKDETTRILIRTGFTTLALCAVVLVTSLDDSLQVINGWVMTSAFILVILAVAGKKEIK